MGAAYKHEPRGKARQNGYKHPFHIEQGIAEIQQMVTVVIMRTFLTMTAMLRTMVFVVVPALLVHRMLALHHNLITRLERRLTEIARLRHRMSPETHLVAGVRDNIPMLEDTITDVRF